MSEQGRADEARGAQWLLSPVGKMTYNHTTMILFASGHLVIWLERTNQDVAEYRPKAGNWYTYPERFAQLTDDEMLEVLRVTSR